MSKLDLGDYAPQAGAPKALFAEALGTCVLVLAAAGAGTGSGAIGGLMGGGEASAWASGLSLVVLVLLFGPVSQAHFNPAITLGMALSGRLSKGRVLPYVVAQFVGALAASLLLRLALRSSVLGMTTTQMNPVAAIIIEAALTFWLQWVILAVTERDVPLLQAALGIGFAVAANILWAGHLTGASMNPFRSLGPAIAAWDFSDLWIYLTGPFLGAVGAAAVYRWYRSLK